VIEHPIWTVIYLIYILRRLVLGIRFVIELPLERLSSVHLSFLLKPWHLNMPFCGM